VLAPLKRPAEVYQPSTSVYTGLPDIDYPFHDKTIVATNCGRICLGHKKINFSTVFAGQAVGIKEVSDDIWLVSFISFCPMSSSTFPCLCGHPANAAVIDVDSTLSLSKTPLG
jgi:hypothetical protein